MELKGKESTFAGLVPVVLTTPCCPAWPHGLSGSQPCVLIRIIRETWPRPRPGLCPPGICSQGRKPYPHHQRPGLPQLVGWRLLMSLEGKPFVTVYQQRGWYPKMAQSFLRSWMQAPSQTSEPPGWGPGWTVGRPGQDGTNISSYRVSARCHSAELHALILVFWNPFKAVILAPDKGITAQRG